MIKPLLATVLGIVCIYAVITVIGLVAIRCVFGLTDPLPAPAGERRRTRSAI
jgi:hypothetical protein